MKVCKICNIEKEDAKFRFFISPRNGQSYQRNTCASCQNRASYLRKKAKRPKWVPLSKEEKLRRKREYNRLYMRSEAGKASRKQAHAKPNQRLMRVLRNRMNSFLRKNKGIRKIQNKSKYLGCTHEELKRHLESKFQPGMTWENRGFGDGKWHIDHIKPLASFDLNNPDHIKEALHYSNLQPLWQADNLKKGSTLERKENRL